MDYADANKKLTSNGFNLVSKEDKISSFVCKFQRADINIKTEVQLGGYISFLEVKNNKSKLTFQGLEISLILNIM